jgi:hypothetical protein
MINISKSRQLINLLQNSNIDENMTVKDLIERVSNNIKKYEEQVSDDCSKQFHVLSIEETRNKLKIRL